MHESILMKKKSGASGILLDINAYSGGIVDSKGHSINASGIAVNSTVTKYGPRSIAFNGSSYLIVPNTKGDLWLLSNFTIECWVYFISKTASFPSLFGNYDTWPNNNGLQLFATHSGANFSGYVNAIAGTFPTMKSSIGVSFGQWIHYAFTRNGTQLDTWINGTSVATGTATAQLFGSKSNIYIGAPSDSPANGGINGYIDRYRILDNALYTKPFTPGPLI